MDRVFSVGDISDQFWSSPPTPPPTAPPAEEKALKMNRSASEWAFQRFLQEASAVSSPSDCVVETKSIHDPEDQAPDDGDAISSKSDMKSSGVASSIPIDPDEYQAFLKTKLNLACAAVALSRASFVKSQDSANLGDNVKGSSKLQSGSVPPSEGSGHDIKSQNKDFSGPARSGQGGVVSLSGMQKRSTATSGSSKDQSDDEEAEEENETTQSRNPVDAKHVRRMLSNRESARRSRRRKQAHLTELETQVSQLRVEKSTLMKRLTDISQKFNQAAVDNRVLKADVETMRAKVKMAEESVKRITGLNPLYHVMAEISTMNVPSFSGSASDTSTDAAVPVQNDQKHQFYQPSNGSLSAADTRVNSGLGDFSSSENVQQNSAAAVEVSGNKMGRSASLQRVASLEHLQKRIRGSVDPPGSQRSGEQ